MSKVTRYEVAIYGDKVELYRNPDYGYEEGTLLVLPLDMFITISDAIVPLGARGTKYPGTFRMSWSEPNE